MLRTSPAFRVLAAVLCLGAFHLAGGTVQLACASPTGGLVSWWPAEGNAMDIAGGNHGAPHSGVTFAPGQVGQAFSFDGQRAGINVPDAENLRITDALTISAWIQIASFPVGHHGMIFFRGDDRFGLDPYYLSTEADGTVDFHVESLSKAADLKAPVPAGQFVHVLATFDSITGLMRIYLNGALAAQTVTTVVPFRDLDPNANPGCGIGNHSGFPTSPHNHPFHGLIDELQIYNRALSASEVQALFSAGAAHRSAVANQIQLVLLPNPVIGGQPAIGQALLAQPAGAGGEVVTLTSSDPAAAVVPAVVTAPAGALTVTFPITTFPVAAATSVTISAGCQFGTISATLQVEPEATPPATPLVLFPNPVPGGLLALGELILTHPAGAGGVTVSLTSSNPAAAVVPAAVTVLPGASAVTFPIVTFPVAAPASVTISAGGAFGAATATLQVVPLSSPIPPAPPAANLLINGSFEQPKGDLFGVSDGVPGWRIDKGTIDIVTNSYWQSAPDGGNQSIDLDGTSVGTIEQSFPTAPGQDYLFSGYVSHNPSVPYGRANVSLNGVFFTQLTHDIPNRNPNMQWQRFTYRFRATAAETTLTLSDVTGINDNQGTVLDGLSVTLAEDQSPPAVAAGAPVAPTGLAARAVSASAVTLTWTDNSANETAFAIWRRDSAGTWVRVGVVPPNTTTFTDTNLAPGTTYTYRVRAIGGSVASDWSNEVTVTSLGPPGTPTALSAKVGGSG